MSSHHVVREKQEPALLILGLDGFEAEYLGQLLEWSPTVLATATVADQLLMAGIHIDYLLADEADEMKFIQPDLQLIPVCNDDALKAGLDFLISKGYPAVNIISRKERPVAFEPYLDLINVVCYAGHKKLYAVTSGYRKWYPAGTRIGIPDRPADLKCNNLVKCGNGLCKVENDGIVDFYFSDKWLIIIEEI